MTMVLARRLHCFRTALGGVGHSGGHQYYGTPWSGMTSALFLLPPEYSNTR